MVHMIAAIFSALQCTAGRSTGDDGTATLQIPLNFLGMHILILIHIYHFLMYEKPKASHHFYS